MGARTVRMKGKRRMGQVRDATLGRQDGPVALDNSRPQLPALFSHQFNSHCYSFSRLRENVITRSCPLRFQYNISDRTLLDKPNLPHHSSKMGQIQLLSHAPCWPHRVRRGPLSTARTPSSYHPVCNAFVSAECDAFYKSLTVSTCSPSPLERPTIFAQRP